MPKKVEGLSRIFTQIIKLRPGSIDIVVIRGFKASELAPVEVQSRQKAFSVKVARVVGRCFIQNIEKILALHLRRNAQLQDVKRSGHEVGKIGKIGNRLCRASSGQMNDEGNVQS
ncbi:MAG: hypothetical protein DMG90_03995 [Acidobacteria bacterium]|nr:MAG: hypothetical protein DMG90_03995 [Acidobacteriota bacterium]